ncbi:MAG: hypothetical protein J6T91_04075 [Alphaproteobacteria bacterium]|nr:hypothetical protein [Alphaproteobacteria bacterium]
MADSSPSFTLSSSLFNGFSRTSSLMSSSCLKASVMVISPHGAQPVFASIFRIVKLFSDI